MARILIIDDSEVIRQMLSEFLTDAGYEVETAADGDEGLAKIRNNKYDLCFCDLHLPRRTGYDLWCELGPRRESTCFIFTDSLPDGLAEKVQELTGCPCLRKPFDLDQVREVLRKTLVPVKST